MFNFIIMFYTSQMLYKNELFFHIFELSKESFFALCNLFFFLVVGKPLGGPSLLGDLLFWFLGSGGVFSDCSMCLGIHSFDAISSNSVLDEGSKLSLVCIFIFFNKMSHIISDVFTEDMITVNGGIEFGSFLVVSREPLGGMRDIQTSIDSTLHGTEDTGSGGCSCKTYVQASMECSWTIIQVFDFKMFSVNLGTSFIHTIKVEFLQNSSC